MLALIDMADEKLILVPIPSLISLLLRAEQVKGAPLTEAQVLSIRDGCTCAAMDEVVAAGVARGRGYDDIDPQRCWEQWQIIRKELIGETAGGDLPARTSSDSPPHDSDATET